MPDLRVRDRLINFISAENDFRATIVQANDSIRNASEAHSLNPLTRLFLGQLILGSQLAGAHLKGEETISLKVNCTGSLKGAVAETNGTGELRGYVSEPNAQAEGNFRAEMIWQAIGEGELTVQKWQNASTEPTRSIVPLLYRNLAKDLTWYYFQSEQINTAIKIEINLSEKFEINSAYALMVQALPGAKEEECQLIENEIEKITSISEVLESEYIDKFFTKALKSFSFRESYQRAIDFFCRCSKQSFAVRMRSLPKKDLLEMAADGSQEIICHYCASKYYFTPEDLRAFAEA